MMENAMPWLGPLKQFVLVWFFVTFTAVWIWTYSRGNRQLEELRHLPFEGDPDSRGGQMIGGSDRG